MPHLAVPRPFFCRAAAFTLVLNLSCLPLPALAASLPRYLQAPPMAQAGSDKVQLPLYPWTKQDGALLACLLMAVVMKVVA